MPTILHDPEVRAAGTVNGTARLHRRVSLEQSWRVLTVVLAGAIGGVLATVAAMLIQPRIAPAVFESDSLLQVGQDTNLAGAGALQQYGMPQDVQAVAQTINTTEVAAEAARRSATGYTMEDFLSQCKASQQQDTRLIVVKCRARDAQSAEKNTAAMASAAISVNDQRFDAQKRAYSDNLDSQKRVLDAQLSRENQRIAELTAQGATADKNPQMQVAVSHASQLNRDIDQLNSLALQLPLSRRTGLYLISGPTQAPGPSTPTPREIIAAAGVAGVAAGLELGLLLTRSWRRG
jgi:capsular polysaccharide biosynthesis protein